MKKRMISYMGKYHRCWFAAYDEASDAAAAEAAEAEAAEEARIAAEKAKGGDLDAATQEKVNKILAEERRKYQSNMQKSLDELTALRTKSKLTDSERSELDRRLETMQKEILTKDQLRQREAEKADRKHKEEVDSLKTDGERWKSLYVENTIKNDIFGAATKHKAYNSDQLIAILRPSTTLEEALDTEGKPTGKLIPKVTFEDKDKDKKPITLKLSIDDAVKRMTDMDEYSNLFESEGAGGLGHRGNRGGGDIDVTSLAKDAAKYREAKKKGLIKLD